MNTNTLVVIAVVILTWLISGSLAVLAAMRSAQVSRLEGRDD